MTYKERWVYRIVLVALAVITIWNAQQSRHRSAEGKQAHDALCVFKVDLQRRASETAAFLHSHPNGLPAAGISAGTLQQSLANQVATIRSLDKLFCDPATPPSVTVPRRPPASTAP